MKQVFINKGKIITEEIPERVLEKGYIKVQTKFSCISMGTELATVASSGKTLLDRIRENPKNLIKGLNLLKEKGISGTKVTLDNSFGTWQSIGYSASGIVLEVAEDIKNIKVGDRVACAGGNYATHSEIMIVPKNLVVKIPEKVTLKDASSVAIGSIAMQGVRRADVRLGEWVCVIGLGLLGQLTIQILKAAGVHVIALDIDQARIEEAKNLKIKNVFNSNREDIYTKVKALTGGMGVDSVIITAATKSSLPLKQAFNICRKKGKVVLVGVVDINIDRTDMYEKELEFLISTSYGPGRYDSTYEENGIDYPYHWVRFTENRNMIEYLKLIENKKIDLTKMYGKEVSINNADKVYESLIENSNRPLMQVFKYDNIIETNIYKVENISEKKLSKNKIKIAVCGIGGFAKNFLLPNFNKINNCEIYSIMTRDGGNSKKTALDYNAKKAVTSYNEITNDPEVDVVIISTRHNLHYEYIVKALKANKDVYVEKPLCLNENELSEIKQHVEKSGSALMVGYNRRFSPHAMLIKEKIKNRINPIIINYVMNAGYIPLDNWVHTEEGGGRIIGEACHIIDLFKYFTEETPISVTVNDLIPQTEYLSNRDNVVITIKYNKGSVATLTYCSNGNLNYPKETCTIFCDNNTYEINDYKETKLFEKKITTFSTKGTDKGHFNELNLFINSCCEGKRFLIPIEDLYETSHITFLINEMLK